MRDRATAAPCLRTYIAVHGLLALGRQETIYYTATNESEAGAGQSPVVEAPTNRGIVLFRTLVHDESHIAEIDAARHYAACEPYRAAGG